jgi:arsenate reductase-like glutaredoxin family protein
MDGWMDGWIQWINLDFNKSKDFDGKLKKLSSECREFGGKGLVDKDLDEILKNTYERTKLIYNYRSKSIKKFNKYKQNISQKSLIF